MKAAFLSSVVLTLVVAEVVSAAQVVREAVDHLVMPLPAGLHMR